MPTLQTFPFDPTGQAVTNLIVNEQHAVQEANYRDYYYIVPTFAPFFASDVSVIFTATDGSHRTLIEGQDYYFAVPFIGATRSIGTPLYGAISFNNSILSGSVSLRYHTLGGDFTTDPNAILQNLALLAYNPRTALWDVITNKPAVFPPINHSQNIDTVFGAEAVIQAIIDLANTIANSSGTSITIGGGTGGGSSGSSSSDTYAVSGTVTRVISGDTVTLDVVSHGATTPDTLYWSMILWNATAGNFDVVSGVIPMILSGGVKRGTFNLTCTNNTTTPVSFNIAIHTNSVGGDIVALSDLMFVTAGDQVIAKSGIIAPNNTAKTGFVFAGERDTGMCQPAAHILDLVVAGKVILSLDETSNTRTINYGPSGNYRFVLRADGVLVLIDDQGAVIFASDDVVSFTQLQALLGSYATLAYVNAAVDAVKVKPSKLYFFGQL